MTPELVQAWHSQIMAGLRVDNEAWIGAFRGAPGLEDIHVAIGANRGTPPEHVLRELGVFFKTLNSVLRALDSQISEDDELSEDQINACLDLCGWVHAEWVRIHPFVNGNGRTARLWANFIAMRYGLPPFVTLRPRPQGVVVRSRKRPIKVNRKAGFLRDY